MRRYFLDTNICVYGLHRRMPHILSRMAEASREELVVSTLVAAELAGGVMRSERVAENRHALELFLGSVTVEGWSATAVWHYGEQVSRLHVARTPIGTIDLLLACQVLADDDAVMVTHNTRGFARINGLALEDWSLT